MMERITRTAAVIWPEERTADGLPVLPQANEKAIFRKHFYLETLPETAEAYIAAETKYYLYINGQEAVYEGGLFRESMPHCGYADCIDIAPFLKNGENVIAVCVWYFGNEGRNNVNTGRAGLYFSCPAVGVESGPQFLAKRDDAYYTPRDPAPSYLYGGDNLGFDMRMALPDWNQPACDESGFLPAVSVDAAAWGDLYVRPVPLLKVCPAVMCPALTVRNNIYTAELPHAMAFFPVLRVNAEAGARIFLCTDHYEVHGGPGDEKNVYRGHRIELICREGLNDFESILYLYGEKITVRTEGRVGTLEVGYRESGYQTEITGWFDCGDGITNRLVEKAARTLYVCMRDNFMDCPDRERGQWIGDVSVQTPQVFFLLDEKAGLLMKKAIYDLICLRKGNVLMGNVPGVHCAELPGQSLAAISEWGMIAQYCKYTGDVECLQTAFLPMVDYLSLWEMAGDGLVKPREGNWRWFDHLYNVDHDVLENCWYVSALRFALIVGKMIGDHSRDAFLSQRLRQIEARFHERFWYSAGGYYASGANTEENGRTVYADDRANAMAVLAGLCPPEHYPDIRNVLISVLNASVYMENFVLTALCEMGYVGDAYRRMISRYYPLAVNRNSTLWEDFHILGTTNHAWSGAPATIAFRYLMGIDTNDGFRTFTVCPQYDLFDHMACQFHAGGRLIRIEADGRKKTYSIFT